ncbi:ubiquitin-like-conjugating enzyme ATG10 isoform X3 [Hippopotamus amphibius kiboko]|nr:ubiquitin-like-conjugating enzyme ATG10 isoform X3 [Hippopotamus amphibius kiboko]XP_057595989.1 ubiquitin-like-conjugating enzyme ATG10 isoform X3 [Hippopotamus amphibius kiboko]XP_057595998.1 ubiquitin-like-conjugating enzyme ATG10 isoform X3 [Hippopotamus amphibius kiboko]
MEEDEFFGEKTFQHYCAEFIKHSQKIGDGWEWRTSKDYSDGYMCKTHFQIKNGTAVSHRGTSAHVQTCLPVEEALEPPLDDFELTETTTATEVIKYEYHVLYSCSYQVPVLYFRASFLDGSPLALKDIWEGVHECYKMRLLQGPWDTITQQEHPILGQPFFVLHPCKTNEFMTPVLKNSQKINRVSSPANTMQSPFNRKQDWLKLLHVSLLHSAFVRSWKNHFTSLVLRFFMCTMRKLSHVTCAARPALGSVKSGEVWRAGL